MAITEYDDFYGDQSSHTAANSDDGDDSSSLDNDCVLNKFPSEPFGKIASHEFRSLESSVQTLSYLDGYDETKEAKLQQGFSDGYRKSFHDAFRVGRRLGSLCAKAVKDELLAQGVGSENSGSTKISNLDQSTATKAIKEPAVLVRRFLQEEILVVSKDKANDTKKYDDALLQLENQLGKIIII